MQDERNCAPKKEITYTKYCRRIDDTDLGMMQMRFTSFSHSEMCEISHRCRNHQRGCVGDEELRETEESSGF